MENSIRGKHIEERSGIINEALENERFKELIQEINALSQTSFDFSQPILAYEFEQVTNTEIPLKGQFVVFESDDGKARIRYDKGIVGHNTNSVVSGKAVIEQNDENVIKGLAIINDQKYWLDDQFKDELDPLPSLKNDPTFENEDSSNDVEAMAPTGSFCLYDFPEFYNHCGPDCGDNGDKGGGPPINGLDTCCRTHDRCYANFGYYDCECDVDVVACAAKYTDTYPTNASAVIAWFGNVNQC